MQVHIWEHVVSLKVYYRTNLWMLMNLVRMKCSWSLTSVVVVFFVQIRPGVDPGWKK